MLNFREELSKIKEKKSKLEEIKHKCTSKNIKAVENLFEKLLQYFLKEVDLANFSKGIKFRFNVQGMYIYGREHGRCLAAFSSVMLDSYDDAKFTFNFLKDKFKYEGYEITEEEKYSFHVIIKA